MSMNRILTVLAAAGYTQTTATQAQDT
jgi:hypothetical protein